MIVSLGTVAKTALVLITENPSLQKRCMIFNEHMFATCSMNSHCFEATVYAAALQSLAMKVTYNTGVLLEPFFSLVNMKSHVFKNSFMLPSKLTALIAS